MAVQFRGLGRSRARLVRRDRLVWFGGTTLMFALIVFGALLVYSHTIVQAGENVVVQPANETEVTFGTVVLVAPTTNIPKGSKVSGTYLREIPWPRDRVPEGAIRDLSEVDGWFSTSALSANQPILRSSVAPTPPSFGIGELLPAGHRAVTIAVDAISGVEGWATAGVHVDVYLTYLDPKEGVHKTRVAVEDAVVLSYGGAAKKSKEYDLEKTKVENTVTLAVPFEDSLKIQTAKAVGRITLALRNSTDVTSQGRGEFSANDWDGSNRPKQPDTPAFQPRGYARYTTGGGNDQQFVLGSDDKWWKSTGEDY